MKKQNCHARTIWIHPKNPRTVQIIDQRFLPHRYVTADLKNVRDAVTAIKDMLVRGAPLIGVTAAYGMALALSDLEKKRAAGTKQEILEAYDVLLASRPTAVNLRWALDRQMSVIQSKSTLREKIIAAFLSAETIAEEDVKNCESIGNHGLKIIEAIRRRKKGKTVNILTHCNAGWLACVEWGTATAPIYKAFEKGLNIHVWVDETRPRNQGASLTAWELGQRGVPHTVIADNAGGHLMQHGLVDMAIVGTDRTTRRGDVANKIGTYLKALAAYDNGIPFYVAAPSSSIDWTVSDGIKEIVIEERSEDEVRYMQGLDDQGKVRRVLVTPKSSRASNYGFDVTPAKYVTGIITERGISRASEKNLLKLFPEQKKRSG